jgi:hypothetical protein
MAGKTKTELMQEAAVRDGIPVVKIDISGGDIMQRLWVFEMCDTHERIEVRADDFDSAALMACDAMNRPGRMVLVAADGVDLEGEYRRRSS